MPSTGPRSTSSQTLLRGITLLELMAAEPSGSATVTELAEALALDYSVVYRLLRTFEDRSLVHRVRPGEYELGLGLVALARRVMPDLQEVSTSELERTARELGATVFVSVEDGEDCVTLASAEPHDSVIRVVRRLGTRHSLWQGSSGRALLSLREEGRREHPGLAEIAQRGFASSSGEVLPGVASVAVAVALPRHNPIAVGALFLTAPPDEDAVAAVLRNTGERILARL